MTLLLVVGCASSPEPVESEPVTPAEQPEPESMEEGDLYTPAYKPNGKETAVITTSKGNIEIALYGTDAPIHVGNFVELAKEGFYDETKFHRYEDGFVVQGGDPQTKEMSPEKVVEEVQSGMTALGTGGPGYQIRGEFDPAQNPNKHVEGALGMARSQSPDSAGSQFYFTLTETPFLDGQYTVFGVVTKGLDIVKSLRVGDVIEKVEIIGSTE
jgi:peptidyl-prolyl cis-trans isomerase B (cyclophilin B)